MDSIEPASDSEHVDHVLEIHGGLFETGRQFAHVLRSAEKAFHDVPDPVEVRIVGNGFARVGLRGIAGNAPSSAICRLDFAGSVCLVRDNRQRLCISSRKGIEDLAVVDMTARNLHR